MTPKDSATTLRQIRRPIRLTLLGLWAEGLCRAFWPLWSLLITSFAALAFDAQDRLPLEAFWFGAVSLTGAALWALIRGLRHFHWPSRAEAMARVDARLPGQPIAALTDTQALGSDDPATRGLWALHQSRMASRAANATAVAPDLKLAARDPFALRYVALLAFVMALMFGSIWQATSVGGLLPGGAQAAASGPAWEGWAEPPAYTGKPVLYLADQTGNTLALPKGSKIRLRFYGTAGSLILAETVSGRTDAPPASSPSQDFLVTQDGNLQIEGPGGRTWEVKAIPDLPPTIAADGALTREPDGKFGQKFLASDDYGVTRGEVSIALDMAQIDRRFGLAIDPEPQALTATVLDLPLPMKRDRTKVQAQLSDDLSQSLMANLPVTMNLSVTDAAGQTGMAPVIRAPLPGRRFFDPLAAALIEMRRDLMWNRANAPRVTQLLKAATWSPEGFIRNDRAYLRLRVLIRNLDTSGTALTTEDRDVMVAELWKIALLVEEGDLASALERLRRAEDRLSEAIKNGASPDEIDKLMQDMREALNDYMQQQAEQNPDGQSDQAQNGQTMTMTQDQLQSMLDRLQQLMKEGRTAEAQELMDQLRQFMENMKVTQGQPGQGQGQGNPGQQAMRDLGQTLKDQQGLADDGFKGMQQQGEGGTGQDGQSLAERQQQLRDRLDQLKRQGGLPGQGNPQGEEGQKQLDRAGRAMDQAEQALRDGDLSGALDQQAEAMDALREGIKDFGQALAQNDQQGDSNGATAERQDPQGNRDPLGRSLGTSERLGADANLLQGPDVYRRAQDLLDEIRRRAGEQTRPEGERSYLKRLLDLF